MVGDTFVEHLHVVFLGMRDGVGYDAASFTSVVLKLFHLRKRTGQWEGTKTEQIQRAGLSRDVPMSGVLESKRTCPSISLMARSLLGPCVTQPRRHLFQVAFCFFAKC